MTAKNKEIKIKKLDKDRYVHMPTGEIRQSIHIKNRQQDLNYVIVSIRNIRDLLNHNFTGHINEKWIILTYKENMKEGKKLYKDTEKFIKTLRYQVGDFEYVAIPEPQERGAWHMNLICKFKNNPGKLDNDNLIFPLWRNGWTKVKRISSSIGLGIYLSVYLTDLVYSKENIKMAIEKGMNKNDAKKSTLRVVEGNNKKFIKGARLYLYPPGFRMFRKSKGIVYPSVDEGGCKEVKKRNNLIDKVPSFTSESEVMNDEGKLVNIIIKEKFAL